MKELRKFKEPVLVLGGGFSGLGLARTLGKHGIDVYLVVDRKDDAIFSKYCKRSYLSPNFRHSQEVLRDLLRKIGRRLNKRVLVYPTSDLVALNLSKLKNEFTDNFHFVVGNEKSVEILVNKNKFYKLLDREGVNYPTTYFPKDAEEIPNLIGKMPFPIFIRPPITQLFNRIFGTHRKGFIAYSLRESIDYYRLAARYGIRMMLQEIIPGPPSNSYQLEGYYNKNYRPTVFFARRRLRIWPPGFGNTTLCVSIPIVKLDKEKKTINEIIKKIGYSGLMSAEFKEDGRDGTLKLLEINARAWWHHWLSARCGADIIFSSYLDAIGEKTEYTEEYETDVKSMCILLDVITSAKMLRNRELSFHDWTQSIWGIDEFALFRRGDVSPFIVNCANEILKKVRDFKK